MAVPVSLTGLVVRDATVRSGGITALDGVSLAVGAGEVVGVIGPNGAGRATRRATRRSREAITM